jgi:hypothetical protein
MRPLTIPFLLPLLMGVFLLVALSACQSNTPVVTPTPNAPAVTVESTLPSAVNPLEITPSNDMGMVIGRAISISTTLPMTQTTVYLAEVFRDPAGGEEGAFVLNSAASPGAITDNEGNFFHTNVKPGEYVLVVGDPYFEYEVIENPDTQEAQTYFVEAGQVTQVGDLQVPLE